MTVCIDNSQDSLIIDSGAHFSIVARGNLDHHSPNWENQLFPTKAKNLKSASGKGNIRLNPELIVLEDDHIQGFLLGKDYQRMYGIEIYNSKNRHITIGTNKEKTFSLDIYQVSSHEPIEELLNEFRVGQLSITLTIKQKLSLLKMLRKNRPAFSIGKEPLDKIRVHDTQLYLDVERPYPPMLRRPPSPENPYERIKYELRNPPVLILPDFELPFKLYIDAACSQGLGAALHQRQTVDVELREGVICYISRQLKDSEARYGATQTECLCLVWALEKLHYYLEVAVFDVYTDCTALKSLLNMNTTNRNILRLQIAIQEYRGNITIIYKEGKSHTNADDLSRWPLHNVKSNSAYDPEVEAKISIHFMELDRRKNFRFSEWAPGNGTPVSGDTGPE
ncbi:hypothetical protein O181_035599 [Austropuccinia psidii MF-1]|uniref:Reverse transcriptase RNase H-like domain-containing protein n=1 Tax=Austropuccinia psidii MF-1 TaxID=1389203 RepID=A0A9Q3D322_9BASI|nr:hypothetical protein [Austropuccinia psidii MF-1]